jgi:hypothetical protein
VTIEPLAVLRRIRGRLVQALRAPVLLRSKIAAPCQFSTEECQVWVSVHSGKIRIPEEAPRYVVLEALEGSHIKVISACN